VGRNRPFMKAADRLVLPGDLVFMSPGSLAPDLREQLKAEGDDVVLTRPHSRARSLVIDAPAAAFLRQFREPSTLVDAVVRHASHSGEDPESLLEAAASLIARLRSQHFIATDEDGQGEAIEPTMQAGQEVGGARLLRCVHLFENVEVY